MRSRVHKSLNKQIINTPFMSVAIISAGTPSDGGVLKKFENEGSLNCGLVAEQLIIARSIACVDSDFLYISIVGPEASAVMKPTQRLGSRSCVSCMTASMADLLCSLLSLTSSLSCTETKQYLIVQIVTAYEDNSTIHSTYLLIGQ